MTELRGVGGEAAGPGEAMDSRQVCDILAAVAAEVLSEVRAGRWHPPATLQRPARHRTIREAGRPAAAGAPAMGPPATARRG
jgi:hypothetical protein